MLDVWQIQFSLPRGWRRSQFFVAGFATFRSVLFRLPKSDDSGYDSDLVTTAVEIRYDVAVSSIPLVDYRIVARKHGTESAS
jgi:hypothetical protein